MNDELKNLALTIKNLQSSIESDYKSVSEILNRFARFLQNAYSDRKQHLTGEQLRLCLDDAFSISILLFSMIDRDIEGVDDRLSSELEKLKTRYLGQ